MLEIYITWQRRKIKKGSRDMTPRISTIGELHFDCVRTGNFERGGVGALVDKVVKSLLKMLEKPGLYVAKYPTGLDEKLKDFEFLKACDGLPLALKVFGANLYGRDISYWKDELESFPSEIKNRLKISFDALDPEEKQMFLDIACFFRGQNRDMAISIWNESGWKGRRGIQNLQDKCLVEVDTWNVMHMHDQVRDMGRDVAEKLSLHHLWRWTDNVIHDLQSSILYWNTF